MRESEGKELHFFIEPEPYFLLDNSAETVDFFTRCLFPIGGDHLVKYHGVSQGEARDILQRHVTVCYDTCHFAIEYEVADIALERFRSACIRIGKVQISLAMKLDLSQLDPKEEMKAFDEPVYVLRLVGRRST